MGGAHIERGSRRGVIRDGPGGFTGLFLAVALGVAAVLAILLVVEASTATFSEKHSARAMKVLALLFGRDEPADEPPPEEPRE